MVVVSKREEIRRKEFNIFGCFELAGTLYRLSEMGNVLGQQGRWFIFLFFSNLPTLSSIPGLHL